MRLSSNGSRGTCIPQGLSTFLHAAFTAHRWHATATAGWPSCPHHSTFRQVLRSVHAAVPVPQRDIAPPRSAQAARAPTPYNAPAAVQAPFFEFVHGRMRADMQHARRVTDTTGIHRHLDYLLLHLRGLTAVGVVQQKRPADTGLLAAAVALLALPGLAMADTIRVVTVRTMEDLEDHEGHPIVLGLLSCRATLRG
jgi:hypothetical protein